MKNKSLLITTIIFFLLINTIFFWEGKLGIFAMLTTLILIIVYLILTIAVLIQTFMSIKEKLRDKHRILLIFVMILVLLSTAFRPYGLINFDRLAGEDILIAKGEGSANCMTTFKLKKNNKFVEHSICFGVTEIKGKYSLKGDTVFFYDVRLSRYDKEYYKFALIKPGDLKKSKDLGNLLRCNDYSDTLGYGLQIVKNDLK